MISKGWISLSRNRRGMENRNNWKSEYRSNSGHSCDSGTEIRLPSIFGDGS